MQSSLSSLTAFAISLPFSLSHSFVSNVRISDSSLSSSSHFFLFFPFFFTSPFHSTRYIHVVPRCLLHANTFIFLVTLFTNENPLLLRSVSPYLVPLALSLHRSLSPPLLHLLLAIAHHPFCFLRRFVDRDEHTLKWTSKSGRGGIKKVFTACSDPSPPPCSINAFEEIQRLVARGSAKGQGKKRKETKGRQIGDCNLRGTDPRGWGIQGIGKNE